MNPINSPCNQPFGAAICPLWKLVLKLKMLKAERVYECDYLIYQDLIQLVAYGLLKAAAQPCLLTELLRRELYGFQSHLYKVYRS
jgi:hypothetical protein